jgi:hypothetical protein
MTNAEVLARVVGILTVAYEARRDHSQSEDDLAALFGSLLDDLGAYEGFEFGFGFNSGDPPEAIQDTMFVAAFTYAFNELALEYEAARPDADVPSLLRRLGIQSAEDGG